MAIDPTPWRSLELHERVVEGNRNEVWRATFDGDDVAVRRSRRSAASLEWELDLIAHLDQQDFIVPTVIESADGRRHVDGVVVQRWLSGDPPSSTPDWVSVSETLQRLHQSTKDYPQRPGACAVAELERSGSSLDADMSALPDDVAADVLGVFAEVAGMPLSVIHGDPMAGNIRIGDDGGVGLLDFDESRVDVAAHDLSNLGVQVLDDVGHARALNLSDAWETANGWVAEPAYARRRLAALRASRRQ